MLTRRLGGEEDGVNNEGNPRLTPRQLIIHLSSPHALRLFAPLLSYSGSLIQIFAIDVDNNSLYTQPEDIHRIYKTLSPISPYFSIAAGFGNVHGVYKPGNVRLHPELLDKHQNYVKDQESLKDNKPVFLVFHGGSGSSKEEYKNAISYGVVKVVCQTVHPLRPR